MTTDKPSHTHSSAQVEEFSKYLFSAPSWRGSLALILVIGIIIELISWRMSPGYQSFGVYGFIIPGISTIVLTTFTVSLFHKPMPWNRSALIAAGCTVVAAIMCAIGLIISRDLLLFAYATALGVIFALRLLILISVADNHLIHMFIPAVNQSIIGFFGVWWLVKDPTFAWTTLTSLVFFGLSACSISWFINAPLKRAYRISGTGFLNAFFAHLTDGSKDLEEYFREIGEEAFVPQVSLFFHREHARDLIFTIPNLHPGPLGEIGGGNFPMEMRSRFEEEIMVAHGCATHDLNLVAADEIDKVIDAINNTRKSCVYQHIASRCNRVTSGSVSMMYQRFGDTLLLVSTRSPDKTEDIEFSIGHAIMCEGHRITPNIGFVDAHNSIGDEIGVILPGTRIAHEYFTGARSAFDAWDTLPVAPFEIGYAHVQLPFGRKDGFGDIGVQVMVVSVSDQKTAYVLIDGNNMNTGVRETLRDLVLSVVDEAEIMTTDTHVVNTVSGKNPIGYHVPADDFSKYILEATNRAIADLRSSTVAGTTASCESVIVFGSNSIAQLASIANTILLYIIPISFGILVSTFLLLIIAYWVLLM